MNLRLSPLRGGWRQSLFLLAAASLLALCAAIAELRSIQEGSEWRIIAFFLFLPICVALTFTWPRTGTPGVQAAGVLLLALVARLALFPHPVDSDANRYLWEGRLVRDGYDPYAHIASAPEWAGLHDAYWQGMNQKDLCTIYPPVAEWVFAAAGGVWYHPMALKAIFVAFDLGSIVLLLAMLSSRSQPLRFAGFYAFNPIPLMGFAAQAHFDSLLIFFILLALWLRERRRTAWSWAALGLAVQIKLVAVLLAPLFARQGAWRKAWAGAVVAALSVVRMSPRPDAVIVVDGGSIDGTREIAARLGATVVLSEPGRGQQIAAGVAEAKADVVLVLHADSEIAPDTVHRVLAALNARPQAVGGAVGQRFDLGTPNLCMIECLNEVKSVLLGLSFGDQGQLFRRAAIVATGGFPNLPLMEDVELSLRLRAAGSMLYLGGGLVCSSRRWRKVNWLKCCITVVAMTAIYRLRRREGAKIADILYRRYYSTAAPNTERYSAF